MEDVSFGTVSYLLWGRPQINLIYFSYWYKLTFIAEICFIEISFSDNLFFAWTRRILTLTGFEINATIFVAYEAAFRFDIALYCIYLYSIY